MFTRPGPLRGKQYGIFSLISVQFTPLYGHGQLVMHEAAATHSHKKGIGSLCGIFILYGTMLGGIRQTPARTRLDKTIDATSNYGYGTYTIKVIYQDIQNPTESFSLAWY